MVLIGYVSDEFYVAIPNVEIEFTKGTTSVRTRSRASGSVHADVQPGAYRVYLTRRGFTPKWVDMEVVEGRVHHFRLLSDNLSGYVWPKWTRSGEIGQVRLHSPYDSVVTLWRYGWEREFVSKLGHFDDEPSGAYAQILPDGDVTQSGVKWSDHGYSFPEVDPRVYVEAPERSGLYYFHAKDATGAFFSFPWIVAPRRPRHRLAVLASNINWNCYNHYGGRSNYVSAIKLSPRPHYNFRQEEVYYTDPALQPWIADEYDPLSFDRPEPLNTTEEHGKITDPMERRGEEHVAPAEWRLLGWLEREGFGYDYYAETQLHSDEMPLDDYEVLIISTHPEYWSAKMYYQVKAWVFEGGGKLMVLGGNSLNCEVEFLDPTTITVRNNDHRKRPTAYESRFGTRHESEAHLTGVVTTHTGYETGAPYRVIDPSHWALAGTDLAEGDLFGTESLDRRAPGGASGHETDKRTPSSPPGIKLIAKGTNPDDGGAEMVHHRTPSGGEVFSVGSISYTCSIAIDEQISKVTRNVLERFLGP